MRTLSVIHSHCVFIRMSNVILCLCSFLLFVSAEFLHDLCFAGSSTSVFISCSTPVGVLVLCDPAQPQPAASSTITEQPPSSHTTAAAAPPANPNGVSAMSAPRQFAVAVSNEPFPLAKVARLSCAGELCLFDVRKLTAPLSQMDVCDKGRLTTSSENHTCVQVSIQGSIYLLYSSLFGRNTKHLGTRLQGYT